MNAVYVTRLATNNTTTTTSPYRSTKVLHKLWILTSASDYLPLVPVLNTGPPSLFLATAVACIVGSWLTYRRINQPEGDQSSIPWSFTFTWKERHSWVTTQKVLSGIRHTVTAYHPHLKPTSKLPARTKNKSKAKWKIQLPTPTSSTSLDDGSCYALCSAWLICMRTNLPGDDQSPKDGLWPERERHYCLNVSNGINTLNTLLPHYTHQSHGLPVTLNSNSNIK